MEPNGRTRPAPSAWVGSVSWGGVFAGAVIGLGFLLTIGSLWTALGYGARLSWWTGAALAWWLAATAIVSVWIGSYVAGLVGRSTPSAPMTGSVMWGLFYLAVVVGLPAVLRFIGAPAPRLTSTEFTYMIWLFFGTLVVSYGAAVIGAAAGAASTAVGAGTTTAAVAGGTIPPHEHRGNEIVDLRESRPLPGSERSTPVTGTRRSSS